MIRYKIITLLVVIIAICMIYTLIYPDVPRVAISRSMDSISEIIGNL